MEVIEGSGDIVVEPDWQSILNDVLEIAAAHEYWRVITTEMKERGTLSPANGHAMQRLLQALNQFLLVASSFLVCCRLALAAFFLQSVPRLWVARCLQLV